MTLSTFLRQLFSSKWSSRKGARTGGSKRRTRKYALPLRLEMLETRLAPATLTVNGVLDNTTADSVLTLREAMLLVNSGGNATAALGRNLTAGESGQITGLFSAANTIQFSSGLSGQTITLNGTELPKITAAVTINGPGASQLAISGNQTSRVFEIGTGVVAALSGLMIQNGKLNGANGGGAILNSGTLTITNSTLSGNSAATGSGTGGAISTSGTLSITNSTLSNNQSTAGGGGIFNFSSGTVTVSGCSFSGNHASSGGAILNDRTLTVANSTFANNSSGMGGAISNNIGGGTLTISNSTVSNNQASGFGGGIQNTGTLTVTGSTLSGNSAGTEGGAIFNNGRSTVTNSTLTNNTSDYGGAIDNYSGTLTIDDSLLTGNQGNRGGGAIYNRSSSSFSITNSTILSNSSLRGGGIFNVSSGTLSNTTISGNLSSEYGGGGINDFSHYSNTQLTNCTISGNSAPVGAGVYCYLGSLTLTSCSISGNTASYGGGGIDANYRSNVSISNSSISGNSTYGYDGGGVYAEHNQSLTITNSTISGNHAAGAGGGIGIYISAVSVSNSTITGNTSQAGGGIYSDSHSSLQITNSTVSSNSAPSASGVDATNPNSGSVTIGNSIIAGNLGSADLSAPAASFSAPNLIGGNPLLGPLQNNGGPTLTMAPLPGSPAIDAGDNTGAPATDQRGFNRIVNGVIDIGAVEVNSATIALTSSANPSTFSQGITFTVTVSASSGATGTPTGTVSFYDGAATGTPLDTETIDANGHATSIVLSSLSAGTHTITAAYSGDANFIAGTAVFSQTVDKVLPTVGVTAAGGVYNDAAYGVTDATVTGVGGVTLASFGDPSLSYTYYVGSSATGNGSANAPKDAGTYTVVAHWTSDNADYTDADSSPATFTITLRALVVSAAGVSRVYDATTAATVTLSDNHLGGDDVTDNYTSAAFADKNVGSSKSVSVSGITISGADAGNYTLQNTTASTTASITPAALTVIAVGVDKVYDTTTSATVALADNHLGSDAVTDSYTSAVFADKNVGSGKSVSVGGITISGTDADNYTVQNTTASTTANITPASLTVSAIGVDQVYDTITAATVTLADNHLGSDAVTDNYTSAAFADKNAGSNKSVNVSGITISGDDAGNYTLQNTTASTTANITPASLTVSATGVDKVYDTTTAATVALADNHLGGDDVTDNYTSAAFADKNAGSNKSVNVSGITISGDDAGNYTLQNTTASTTANITPASLTVSATGVDKVYDTTTAATVALADNHFGSDAVTDSYASAVFADKNVGSGKSVSVSGIAISGTDAGNYTLQNTTASTTANITPASLTVSATGVDKVYDTTTAATVTLADNHLGSDAVTDNYTSAAFANKNVGTGKAVSVNGITISGGDAGNYTLQNTTASTTANITPASLTVSATGVDKVYDTTTAATVALADNHLGGDDVTDNYTSAAFADKNAGSNKSVNVSGITISGDDAGNYTLQNTTASITANITPTSLTVSAAGADKVYDTTTAATVTLADNHLGSDVVTDSYTSAAFTDKNAGTSKTVSVSGITISGTDAGNYTLQNTTASTTANITPASLMVSAAGADKVYDTTTAATVTLSDNHLGSDVVTDSYTSAAFADKKVGSSKTVSVSGITISGGDAGNYTLQNTTASTTANITPASLTVSATGVDKVYDTTIAATITLADNHLGSDAVTDNYTSAAFADKNAGTGKTVSVSGITISGDDAGNYTLQNTTASTTANITSAALTFSAAGVDKVYDTTSAATVTLADNHLGSDKVTDSYTGAAFADKNVGTGKSVTVSGITIIGDDAGNYTLQNTTASTTANITPAALTVSATGVDKVYDTTTVATVTLADNHLGSDKVSDSYPGAAFTNKNAGSGKTVSVSGITISGDDADNYTLQNTTASTTANITTAALTVSASGINKVYDATIGATATLADNHLGSDAVTDSYTKAAFANKNVGSGKTVSVGGIAISGADAGNYTLQNTTATTTANITPASLTVSATGVNKVYDTTTVATVLLADNRLGSDAVTESYASAAFPDKNVGTGKTVSVGGIAISGADAGNYALQNTKASITANITPASLTITADNKAKVFGAALPTLTASYTGFVGGENSSSLTALPSLSTTATATSPVAQYPITATGAVDPNYAIGYVSGTLTINQDATTTSLTASASNAASLGQSITFTATVTAVAPGSGSPTGTVTFVDAGTGVTLGSVSLANGRAALTTTALPLGSQTITATYNGDTNFVNSGASTTLNMLTADYVLNATASGALSLSGNAQFDLPGLIYVDSNAAATVSASGNANVLASAVDVVGGVQSSGNAHFNVSPVTGAPSVADPLASLAAPSVSGSAQGPVNVGGNSSQTLNPGIYQGITVSGNGKLTLNPGIYVLAGGGFSVSGNGIVTGSGVLLYNANSNYPSAGGTFGAITISGNGQENLSAATTGTYAGMVFFQARANTSAISLSGNAHLELNGGVLYASSAVLNQSGNAHLNQDALIVNELQMSGNGTDVVTGLLGSSTGSRGQALTVTTLFNNDTAALAGSGWCFSLNWGDGNSLAVNPNNGTTVSHRYQGDGTYTVELLATNANGVVVVLGTLTIIISG